MRKFLSSIILIFIFSSGYSQHSNGFGPAEGQTIALGSEVTVDIFKRIDKAWAERDYETLKSYIAKDAPMRFDDGTLVKGPKEFVKKLKNNTKKLRRLMAGVGRLFLHLVLKE